jgi:hypothetical protein
MTAFEVVADTFLDECQIEIVENDSLPLVVDERNPFHFQVDYKNGAWYCEAFFQCRENPDEYVTIRRGYSAEMVASISTFYDGLDDGADVVENG